jgi:UDP-N-acetyl-D-galactosamine dehydrogenase
MTDHIAVIGLGYVGLPLAIEFAKQYRVTGFDINQPRIAALKAGNDHTLEVSSEDLLQVQHSASQEKGLLLTHHAADLRAANVYIITVPTPVDENNSPDLRPIIAASKMVGEYLQAGDIVIYESTVFPGCTEEVCVPVLENSSGLCFNKDFFCGYSPERINPGDKERTITKIRKITSGSTPAVANKIDQLYSSIITAGTYQAASIKVAEAAKVIENAQRDINIAFVNELAKIFHLLNIDTLSVLEAAGTKWNFLPFRPGLVGGHCIGVDPYYLAQRATQAGYHPEIILAGRRLNDGMGRYIANRIIKLMIGKGMQIQHARVLVLGVTFKENCPDIRNTRVIDIVRELQSFHLQVDIHDPWANPEEFMHEYGHTCLQELPQQVYDAVVLAVAHDAFTALNLDALRKPNAIVFDVKGKLDPAVADERL